MASQIHAAVDANSRSGDALQSRGDEPGDIRAADKRRHRLVDWRFSCSICCRTAYTRLILADSVAYFPETYLCNDGKGGIREWNRFDEIPLWPEVIAFAKHEISSGVKGDTLDWSRGDAPNSARSTRRSTRVKASRIWYACRRCSCCKSFQRPLDSAATFFFWQAWRDQAMSTVGKPCRENLRGDCLVDRVTDGCRGGGHFGVCGSLAVANLSWQLSNCRHPSSRSLSTAPLWMLCRVARPGNSTAMMHRWPGRTISGTAMFGW